LQIGISSDPSVDLGFGLNLSRLASNSGSSQQQQSQSQSSSSTGSTMMGDSSNNQLEIMQRINAMLENSLDLSNLTGEVAPKRNSSSYSGK